MPRRATRLFLVPFALVFLGSCAPSEPPTWLKGNLHTHSFWSDGDDFPESIVQWYVDAGYDFLAISDHNTLAEGDRWVEINDYRRPAYEAHRARFPDWIDERRRGDTLEVRLRTFEELQERYDRINGFWLIQAEEITDGFEGRPIHVNATNVLERIEPQGGTSSSDVMQRNIDAVLEQREATGQPMVPHINHPNFGWAITPDDLVPLVGEHFFEVYNGHPAVHNEGDDTRPGTEAIWDYVNTQRLKLGHPLLLGLAVDDAHAYHEMRTGLANPGRGWIMVRSRSRDASGVISALEAGDFYASSGVTLRDIRFNGRRLTVDIEAEEGVSYTTYFVGVPVDGEPGHVFAMREGTTATYQLDGSELFVRATVVSDRPMENPYRAGETEMAWVQPMVR